MMKNTVVYIGDSGYPLEPWLMTPLSLSATTTDSEKAFNVAHAKTRVVIERAFGLWKSRFRCLDKSGGTLLYSANKTCQLVVATAVLHNFCISRRIQCETPMDAAVIQRNAAIQPARVAAFDDTAVLNAVQLRRAVIQQF